MRKMTILIVTITLILSGCVTLSPQAANVMVHSKLSNLLDECKKLGNVSANASAWSQWDMNSTRTQAENNLREKAYKMYKADTVAIVNADEYPTSITVHGIAFKCKLESNQ